MGMHDAKLEKTIAWYGVVFWTWEDLLLLRIESIGLGLIMWRGATMQHLLNSARVISSNGMLRHMRAASHAPLHTGGGVFHVSHGWAGKSLPPSKTAKRANTASVLIKHLPALPCKKQTHATAFITRFVYFFTQNKWMGRGATRNVYSLGSIYKFMLPSIKAPGWF